jgi:hypothetical protein
MGLYQETYKLRNKKRLACTLLVDGSSLGRAKVDVIETSDGCPASPTHVDIKLTFFTGNRRFLPTVANVNAKQTQVETNLK